MMGLEFSKNRREFVIGGSLMLVGAIGYEIPRIMPRDPSLVFRIISILYKNFPEILKGAAGSAFWDGIKIFPLEKISAIISGSSNDFVSALKYGEENGIEIGMAARLIKMYSPDKAVKFFQEGLPLLIQEDGLKKFGISSNSFIVHAKNDTDSAISGQFSFNVIDTETDRQEGGSFNKRVIHLYPGEVYDFKYHMDVDFRTPGIKKVVITNKPDGLTALSPLVRVLNVGTSYG